MSLYRVHFKWKEKEIQLTAKSLDLTHPYFVSIKDIVLPQEKKLIIDPSDDDIRKTFGGTNHIMIPFQTVILIEELLEEGKTSIMHLNNVGEEKTDKKKGEQKEKPF